MCVLENMKANSGPRSPWEVDLGEDDMGQILEQHDANERMETELFTRRFEKLDAFAPVPVQASVTWFRIGSSSGMKNLVPSAMWREAPRLSGKTLRCV